jgi:hypothetical protein
LLKQQPLFYCERMASCKNDLKAVRNLIAEAHDLETSPAAQLGAKGGKQTAKRGSEYYSHCANCWLNPHLATVIAISHPSCRIPH